MDVVGVLKRMTKHERGVLCYYYCSGWAKLRTHAMANASKGKATFALNTRVLMKLMQERNEEQVCEKTEQAERERNAML